MGLNAVICGSGFIGAIHANAYKNVKGVELKGIFDINDSKSEEFSKKYKIKQYKEYSDVLNDDNIDLIDICVPTFKHREYVEKALNACKNVLCEKPLALNLEDAEHIINISEKSNTKFMIGHTHRFYKENVIVQEAATSNKLGKILSCSAYRLGVRPDWSENSWIIDGSKSGGAATDFILHDIDLCNWIGGKPEVVMAQGLRSSNGAWDYMGISIGYDSGIFIEKEKALFPDWEKRDPFEIEIEYFIDCILNQKSIEIVQPIDAFRALQVSLAAKESAQKMKPIRIK